MWSYPAILRKYALSGLLVLLCFLLLGTALFFLIWKPLISFSPLTIPSIEMGTILTGAAVLGVVAVVLLMLREIALVRLQLMRTEQSLRRQISESVESKFIEISPETKSILDMAVEVWRIEQRISKSSESIPENQMKGLENSLQKLRRWLEKHDIEIVDYKNQKFNKGLNLEILSIEKDPSLDEPMVKETVEPTIMCKGQIVRKAKIILLTNA